MSVTGECAFELVARDSIVDEIAVTYGGPFPCQRDVGRKGDRLSIEVVPSVDKGRESRKLFRRSYVEFRKALGVPAGIGGYPVSSRFNLDRQGDSRYEECHRQDECGCFPSCYDHDIITRCPWTVVFDTGPYDVEKRFGIWVVWYDSVELYAF